MFLSKLRKKNGEYNEKGKEEKEREAEEHEWERGRRRRTQKIKKGQVLTRM